MVYIPTVANSSSNIDQPRGGALPLLRRRTVYPLLLRRRIKPIIISGFPAGGTDGTVPPPSLLFESDETYPHRIVRRTTTTYCCCCCSITTSRSLGNLLCWYILVVYYYYYYTVYRSYIQTYKHSLLASLIVCHRIYKHTNIRFLFHSSFVSPIVYVQ